MVGGEIDFGYVYTEEEGLWSAPIPVLVRSTCCMQVYAFHTHTGDADFAMGSEDHASCGIFDASSLSFCGFPHIVLRRGRVACLHSRSPESFLSYPAWYSEKMPTKYNWHCSSIWVLERLCTAAKSNETDSNTRLAT